MKLNVLLIGLSLFSGFTYSKVNPALSVNEDSVCPIYAESYGAQLATGKEPLFRVYQKFIKIDSEVKGTWGVEIGPKNQLNTPMEFVSPLTHKDIVWQKWRPASGLKYYFVRRGNMRHGMGYGILVGTIKPAPDKSMVIEKFWTSKITPDHFIVSIIEDAELESVLARMHDEDIVESMSPSAEGYYPIATSDVVLALSNDYDFRNIFQYNNGLYTADEDGVYKLEDGESRTVCEIGNGLSLVSPQLTAFENMANKSLLTKGKTGDYGIWYDANRQVINGLKNAIEKPMLTKVNKDGSCFKNDTVNLCEKNNIIDNVLSQLASKDPWSYREVQSIRQHAKSAKYVLSQFYIKQLKLAPSLSDGMANQAIYDFLAKVVGFHPNLRYNSNEVSKTSKLKAVDSYTLDDPKGSIPTNWFNKTELMWAAHFNDYDTVQRILKEAEESGNMNIVNAVTYSSNLPSSLKRVNRSALTYALENATLPVIKALMDAGAYTDITDSEGNDLYYYLDKNNFVDLSLEEIIIAPLEEIKPSFDCALASTNQEKAICSNDGLAVYDKHMSDLYKAVRQGQDDDIKVLQRRWLKELKQTCSMTDSTQLNSCLKSQYRTRIQYLNNLIDNNLSR